MRTRSTFPRRRGPYRLGRRLFLTWPRYRLLVLIRCARREHEQTPSFEEPHQRICLLIVFAPAQADFAPAETAPRAAAPIVQGAVIVHHAATRPVLVLQD